VIRARTRIEVLKEQRADAPAVLKSLEEKQSRHAQQIQALERDISEIGLKLENLPVAEIQERMRALKDLEKNRDSENTERIRAIRDNEHADEEIRRLNREVGDLALRNMAAQKLITRRELATRSSQFLTEFLASNEAQARNEIEISVNQVLEITARRHYRFEVDDLFRIRLLFEVGTPTPKSG
jgi:chromosome segregation ATPase